MPINEPAQHTTTDDLDLRILLNRLFAFFGRYGKLICSFSIAGMLAGFALYKALPNQYSSTLLLHSSWLANTEMINIIDNWNTLLKEGETATLAKRFNCNPQMLRKVSSITAAETQKLYIPNNPNGFVLKVVVDDNAILDSLFAGIVSGFENNSYIKPKLDSRKLNLTALIAVVTTEIVKLDSTKRIIENSFSNNNQHASSFNLDISSMNAQAIGLHEKLIAYSDELKFSNAIQVFQKFEKFEKPVGPKFLKLLVLGGIAGFTIGYLLSVWLSLRRQFVAQARRSSALSMS